MFVNEEKWLPGRWILVPPAKRNAKPAVSRFMPCLSRVQLEEMGVRVDSFPALKMSPPEACVAFDEIIPRATSRFDFNTQTLHLPFHRRQ